MACPINPAPAIILAMKGEERDTWFEPLHAEVIQSAAWTFFKEAHFTEAVALMEVVINSCEIWDSVERNWDRTNYWEKHFGR